MLNSSTDLVIAVHFVIHLSAIYFAYSMAALLDSHIQPRPVAFGFWCILTLIVYVLAVAITT